MRLYALQSQGKFAQHDVSIVKVARIVQFAPAHTSENAPAKQLSRAFCPKLQQGSEMHAHFA